MRPLVFLLTLSLEEVEVDVKEVVVVVSLVVSPAREGSVTANLLLESFTDAA